MDCGSARGYALSLALSSLVEGDPMHLSGRRAVALFRALAMIPMIATIGVGVSDAQSIGPDTRVTYGGRPENEPSIAVLGDKAVAVWFQNLQDNGASWGYSSDGG